jgi:hypothetical protein
MFKPVETNHSLHRVLTGFGVLASLDKLHAYYFINKNELTRMMIFNPIGFTKKKTKTKNFAMLQSCLSG